MKDEQKDCQCCKEKINIQKCQCHNHGGSGAIYGLGVIGALFYFLQNAHTFETVMMGIGKSIFWPSILMFKLLTYLKM